MAKTDELPGVEGEGVSLKRNKRLDNACDKWRQLIGQRMAVLEWETKARDKVIEIMHAENITKYPYWVDDETVKLLVLDSSEKLKLKKAEASGDGEGDEEADPDND